MDTCKFVDLFFSISQSVGKQAYKLLYFTAGLLRYWVEKKTYTHTYTTIEKV